MAIDNGDFVRVNFTGKIKETDDVFDTTYEEIAQLDEYCRWALSYLEANCRLSSFTINSYMNTINYRTLEAYRELSNMLEAKKIRRTEQGKSMFKHIVPILTKLHDPEVLSTVDRWWEE